MVWEYYSFIIDLILTSMFGFDNKSSAISDLSFSNAINNGVLFNKKNEISKEQFSY